MRIYICGPISRGNLADNVNQATAAFIELAKLGYEPHCPHWSVYSKKCYADWQSERIVCHGTANGNNELTHADWLRIDLAWVAVADAVLRLPGDSVGADQEVMFAKQRGIPVFASIEQLNVFRTAQKVPI